jgi:hypothetical protein
MTLRRLLVLAVAVAVAGCSAVTPFATAPLPVEPGVKDAGPRVAICYNKFKTPPEKVQELAQAECFGNSVAELTNTDYHLDNCPLMTPGRATFVCRPK